VPWLDSLQRLVGRSAPVNETRWVVLDVETSGLDIHRDRLLAIAAIAVRVDWPTKILKVDLGDSFEVVLQQDEVSSKDNILLHGIGVQQQRDGMAPALALQAFTDFIGDSPLLAFHAAFDQAMMDRFAHKHRGRRLVNRWVDIDHLCAVTFDAVPARALDDWMSYFGISCAVRHQAAADTMAECELLQRIWPKVAVSCSNWSDVQKLAAQHRWMVRADRHTRL
jgi:DNA polymerase III subunit epsilon